MESETSMKQAVLTAPYTFELRDVPVPQIAPEQVLLRVARVGVCGSDVQMYHGRHKYMTYPVVPGHEVSAIVQQVGARVQGYSVGDKVTVEPQVFCGTCQPCAMGRFNVCESLRVMGVHMDGFAAEFVAVDAQYLHLCPPDMDLDLIALVEPLAVGVGAVKRGNYKNANIAVIGAGTIGNLIAQSARALGAGDVLITDIMDARLDLARRCGIEKAVNTKAVSLPDAILQAFGPKKADIIIDAAATASSFSSCLAAARPSSDIIITGNYKDPMQLEVPLLQRREVNLIGHMMYVRQDFADAIAFLKDGSINAEGIITSRFALRDVVDGFAKSVENASQQMKVVMDISEND